MIAEKSNESTPKIMTAGEISDKQQELLRTYCYTDEKKDLKISKSFDKKKFISVEDLNRIIDNNEHLFGTASDFKLFKRRMMKND